MPRLRALSILGCAAAALSPAAAAQASTITLDRACYVPRQSMVATGSGFTPGSQLALGGDHVFPTATADPAGAFTIGLAAPPTGTTGARPSSVSTQTLTATNPADPAQTASLRYRVANFDVDRGASTNPRSTRTWYFSGFPTGSAIYGHFRLKGKTVANHRFGRATGPCGLLHARARGIPVKQLRTGTWTLQIDGRQHYRQSTLPALVLRISVFLRPR
jgi:hypothetical protein